MYREKIETKIYNADKTEIHNKMYYIDKDNIKHDLTRKIIFVSDKS